MVDLCRMVMLGVPFCPRIYVIDGVDCLSASELSGSDPSLHIKSVVTCLNIAEH